MLIVQLAQVIRDTHDEQREVKTIWSKRNNTINDT